MPLKSLKVVINDKPLDAMIDSGAQVVLLNRSVLCDDIRTIGEIQVQGVFGNTVTADIVPVDVKRCNDDVNECGVCMLSEPMQIFCGVVDNIASGYDMILPADIADELLSLPLFHTEAVTLHDGNSFIDVNLDQDTDISATEECVVNVDCMNDASGNATVTDATVTDTVDDTEVDNDVDNEVDDINTLINEQYSDATLTGCHKLAAVGKGNFVYRNGVSYHVDRVFGQPVW